MQTLSALAHLDYNQASSHSYEDAFLVLQRLKLSNESREELFRRMTFNIIARNQDDHVKNIAFLMDKKGQWSLSPSYDVSYNYHLKGLDWATPDEYEWEKGQFHVKDFTEIAKFAQMVRGERAK